MNVLVIGGAGYIGSHVVYDLLRQQQNVVVLDDLSTGNKEAVPEKASFYEGDQTDLKKLNSIFKAHQIDVVMHFSAKLIVPESVRKPIEYFENNVHGVAIILQAMVQNGVKNIVFSSTAAVYGSGDKQSPVKEDDIKKPMQPYGQSKLACEWLIKGAQRAHRINYAIFRYFNVAGADMSGEIGQATKGTDKLTHLIPVLMEVATRKRDLIEIYGDDYNTWDGTCVRDYVHVNDVADAHIRGARFLLTGKSGTFNIGSNHGFSVLEIVEKARSITKCTIKSKICKRREGDPAFLVASNAKIKRVLGWTPKYGIEEMIKSDYKWRLNKKF